MANGPQRQHMSTDDDTYGADDKVCVCYGFIEVPDERLSLFIPEEGTDALGFHDETDVGGIAVLCVAYADDYHAIAICVLYMQKFYGSDEGVRVHLWRLEDALGLRILKDWGQPFTPGLVKEIGVPMMWQSTDEQREHVRQMVFAWITPSNKKPKPRASRPWPRKRP